MDRPPLVLEAAQANYPFGAKQDKIEGRVVVRFVVDTDGRAQEAEVLEAEPAGVFESAALEAVALYKFEPASKNGMPVHCIAKMPVVFKLDAENKQTTSGSAEFYFRSDAENNPSISESEKTIAIDLHDANIKVLIRLVGDITGKQFVVDNDVKGKFTFASTEPISIDELNALFESVLNENGYAAVPSGDVIRIMKK